MTIVSDETKHGWSEKTVEKGDVKAVSLTDEGSIKLNTGEKKIKLDIQPGVFGGEACIIIEHDTLIGSGPDEFKTWYVECLT